MRLIPFVFFLTAFLIRLVIVQLWKIPQVIYVPVELLLLALSLYFERDRLSRFFVRTDRLKGDFTLGVFVGIAFCILESIYLQVFKGHSREFRLDTLALIPLGILLAGWRAGVYEELLFRSLTMGYLKLWSGQKPLAVIGQGLLFWIAHIRYFNVEGDWGIASLIFGLGLGWITAHRGSIIPAMIIHSIGNSYGGATLPPAEYLEKALRSWL